MAVVHPSRQTGWSANAESTRAAFAKEPAEREWQQKEKNGPLKGSLASTALREKKPSGAHSMPPLCARAKHSANRARSVTMGQSRATGLPRKAQRLPRQGPARCESRAFVGRRNTPTSCGSDEVATFSTWKTQLGSELWATRN